MGRALLVLFTVLSCLVLAITAWLWPRSHRVASGWAWDDGSGRRRELVSYAGAIHVRELTGPGYGASPGGRSVIREDVPQGADWQTRCGGGMNIVWQKAGFAVASGSTPIVLMTWPYPVQQVQGTIKTSFLPSGGSSSVPVLIDGSSSVSSVQALTGVQSVTAMGNVIITDAGNSTPMTLTAQQISYVPNLAQNWQLAVVVPYWSIAALASLHPAYCLTMVPAALRRRRRLRSGLCVRCGYDMRATRDRCPECGAAASLVP